MRGILSFCPPYRSSVSKKVLGKGRGKKLRETSNSSLSRRASGVAAGVASSGVDPQRCAIKRLKMWDMAKPFSDGPMCLDMYRSIALSYRIWCNRRVGVSNDGEISSEKFSRLRGRTVDLCRYTERPPPSGPPTLEASTSCDTKCV